MSNKTSAPSSLSTTGLFGEWLPIETAPKNRKMIIVWCPENKSSYMVTWDDAVEYWVTWGSGSRVGLFYKPSHWMPAPNAPNTEDIHGAKRS